MVSSGRVSRTWGRDGFHFSLRSRTWSVRYLDFQSQTVTPLSPAGVRRARGRRVCGGCAGCLWDRERCACVRLCFIKSRRAQRRNFAPSGVAWLSAHPHRRTLEAGEERDAENDADSVDSCRPFTNLGAKRISFSYISLISCRLLCCCALVCSFGNLAGGGDRGRARP